LSTHLIESHCILFYITYKYPVNYVKDSYYIRDAVKAGH